MGIHPVAVVFGVILEITAPLRVEAVAGVGRAIAEGQRRAVVVIGAVQAIAEVRLQAVAAVGAAKMKMAAPRQVALAIGMALEPKAERPMVARARGTPRANMAPVPADIMLTVMVRRLITLRLTAPVITIHQQRSLPAAVVTIVGITTA